MKKRGLAQASKQTRNAVAKSGGYAPHRARGLAAADQETRRRVAQLGGRMRATDEQGLAAAGKKGGMTVKANKGLKFFSEIGKIGGRTVADRYGSEHFKEMGRKGGVAVKDKYGNGYFQEIALGEKKDDNKK